MAQSKVYVTRDISPESLIKIYEALGRKEFGTMSQEPVALTAEKIRAGKTSLGIEFGSTRIKAVLIDDEYHTIAAGDYGWAIWKTACGATPRRRSGRACRPHTPRWPATWKPLTARN